uniref:IRG-type G domain-containing protein n=1 Tax=Anolis carolinensis TaxID=28377 RepID=H9GA00_ANOCA|nr:PREDICTED: interferon-inducible GTPase 5 [Anolis carolinensis]|eukprot:XP_008123415.1 PREDICTED: interferon-inducible GTPase 5 [Anolis carolinensis]
MASAPQEAVQNHQVNFEEYHIIAEKDIKVIKDALEGGRMSDAVSKIMENLQNIENARLDIAVTGECGSGKSSFINAIRGLGDEEEGSAPTGVVETTREPIPYPHPKHPNVTMWDLPGIGTPDFQSSTYLKQVNFSRYDFFFLIASERFKANHAMLANKIKKQGKHFYFVRSKVDADLEASKKRRPRSYNEEMVLTKIRENCQDCLKKEGVDDPHVFLLSSWELSKYDFMLLEKTLERELPNHKRHAFLLALPNISIEILKKKKKVLQKQIWKLATISCVVATVPIPGLSITCDIALLIKSMSTYRKDFGLDEESLIQLAEKVGKPVEEIKEVIKSPLVKKISKDLVIKLLTKAGGGALMVLGYFVSMVPIFGSLAAGGISFGTTYYMLKKFIDELAEDAQNVLIKVSESGV